MRALRIVMALACALTTIGLVGLVEPADVGQKAPRFTLPDLAGKPVRLDDFLGKKAVLINFWATWCEPCREEMPTLERLSVERRASLAVLGVSLDGVGRDRVRAFVRELGVTFPILLDPGATVARQYRIRALPTSYIVDREGVVRYREIGYRDWMSAESRYLLEEALRPR